ncbi:MAG TPA: hypothetical protein VGL93_33440 [Streptosporangiaceae bacterium]
MRLVFSPYDTDRLDAAQHALLDGFAAWAHRSGRTVERVSAEAMLDYKGAADGLLGRWTTDTLTHLCTERLPGKITLAEADWPLVPRTLHAWIDYLDDTGLLDRRSDPPRRLHTAVDRSADEFHAAMADPARYGVTKFWMTTMLAHGVDLDDEAQRDAFFDDLHAGRLNVDMSMVERIAERQVAEATPTGLDDPDTGLPLVHLQPDDILTKHAADTPAVDNLRRLTTWLAAGRPLTPTGDLPPSDVAALTAALTAIPAPDHDAEAADDRAAGTSGDGVADARLWIRWARAARLVRTYRGRLVPVQRAAADLRDPLALWSRAFDALGALGPAFRAAGDRVSPVTDDLAATTLNLLAPLYVEAAPLPRVALTALIWESAADAYDLDDPVRFRTQIDAELHHLLDALAALGAVRRSTTADPDLLAQIEELAEDAPGPVDPIVLELTELGVRGVNHRARALGWTAPTVDDLAEETAEVLIAAVEECHPDLIDAAVDAWAAAHGPDAADAELAELAARTDDATHRALATEARERLTAPPAAPRG